MAGHRMGRKTRYAGGWRRIEPGVWFRLYADRRGGDAFFDGTGLPVMYFPLHQRREAK